MTCAGSASERIAVGPIAYVRFHGGVGKYWGRYSDERLLGWADWMLEQAKSGRPVWAYFNNDIHAARHPRRADAEVDGRSAPALRQKNPGRSRCLARESRTQTKVLSRALAPAAAAEAAAAGPGRPRSPGSPIRPGTSASPEAAEAAAAAAAEAAAGPLQLRRS